MSSSCLLSSTRRRKAGWKLTLIIAFIMALVLFLVGLFADILKSPIGDLL